MGSVEVEDYKNRVDGVLTQVNRIEQRVHEVEQFYLNNSKKQSNNCKGGSASKEKDKDRDKHVNIKKQQHDTATREAAASKRMQELIRQFGTILRQITQHKWARPFMEPVDVEGLGLEDYYEGGLLDLPPSTRFPWPKERRKQKEKRNKRGGIVTISAGLRIIEKPMDFSTIKKQMEAKDGTSYKHVREICADVRLIFKNAMKYNDEKNDVHVMAKTLLAKFEEKWLQFLPKVTEEEKRLEEEEAEAQLHMQLAQEAAYAKLARDLNNELFEAEMHLDELREQLVQNSRKMSTEEKRQLGTALTRLSTEDLSRALEIVAQGNPGFMANAEEVDLDIDAQSETTLWRLKLLVKDALQAQSKPAASMGGNTNDNNDNNNNAKNSNSKRKREICDALAKTTKKKTKKVGS